MPPKLVLNQISFRSQDANPEPLEFDVGILLRQLRLLGFVVGHGSSTVYCKDRHSIMMTAFFIGESAWKDAWKGAVEGLQFEKRCIERQSDGEPAVVSIRKSVSRPFPVCRCRGNKPTGLRVWCTPDTQCPPLLCEDRGVFPLYRLPLSQATRRQLNEWHAITTLVSELVGTTGKRVPFAAWAETELSSAKGWISKESIRLARIVQSETGIPTTATRPPVSLLLS